MRPDSKLRQGFIGVPTAVAGSKNKKQFPLLAPQGGISWFFIEGEGRSMSRGWAGGVC